MESENNQDEYCPCGCGTPTKIVLDEEATKKLIEIMDNPPKANKKLKEAMQKAFRNNS